jgi:hypothetical protein
MDSLARLIVSEHRDMASGQNATVSGRRKSDSRRREKGSRDGREGGEEKRNGCRLCTLRVLRAIRRVWIGIHRPAATA